MLGWVRVNPSMVLFCFVYFFRLNWGISSKGRAPALHAGGTGIDARILHTFFFFFLLFVANLLAASK